MFSFNNPRKDYSIRPPKQAIANNAFYVIDSANIDFTYNNNTKELTANLTKTGVIAGTYGSSTIVPVITLDVYGRITGIATATIPELLLQTNSVDNLTQTLLNLIAGTNMTITDDGLGNITFDATGGSGSGTVTSVSAGTGMNFTTITTSGSVDIDITKVPYLAAGFSTGLLKWDGSAWVFDTNTYLTTISGLNISLLTNDSGYITSASLTGYVPTTRTLTINGVGYDLSADRSWTISAGTGTVISVDLTMPSAFSVSGNPITTSGTLAVTGAGTTSQYIRGDGSLATYNPGTGGGGNSVSYYLNGSVNQTPTIGGLTYKQMSKTPVIGAGTDFTINADGYIQSFITDVGTPNQLLIPGGNWNFEMWFSANSNGGSPKFYIDVCIFDGTTLTTIGTSSAVPENITGGTAIDLYTTAVAVPQTTLTLTDRIAIRVYVIHSSKTIKLHTEGPHLCQVITTFTTGLTALNGLTDQVQNFSTPGTSGTAPSWTSVSPNHTLNIPLASVASVTAGLISNTDYATFKVGSCGVIFTSVSGIVTNGTTGYAQVPYNGTITGWTLVSTSASGSCTVTVFKDTFANYPPTSPTDNIFTVQPALVSQIKNQDLAPTFLGSQATVVAGDWIGFTISGVALVSWVNLTLSITKT
jgi:hypothetical protein